MIQVFLELYFRPKWLSMPHFLEVVRSFWVDFIKIVFYREEFLGLPVVLGSEENWAIEGNILEVVVSLLDLLDDVFFLEGTDLILFLLALVVRPENYRVVMAITPPAFFVAMR